MFLLKHDQVKAHCFTLCNAQHLHVEKVLSFRQIAEVLNHKVFGTLEEGVRAVSLSDGEQTETIRKIQASYEKFIACLRKNRDLRTAKWEPYNTVTFS